MRNKFGLKDFVIVVLVLGLGVMVFLKGVQQDRHWDKVQDALLKLSALEGQIAKLQDRLDSGPAVGAAAPSDGPAGAPGARDESWARPGVPIDWQPPMTPITDPRRQQGFQPGGELTEAWETQWKCVTPYITPDSYSRRIQELVLGSLGVYDPVTLKMRGQLAEAWQRDPAGLWMRARIRAGARFSDGEPVKAEDVRFSFHDYIMNEQIEAERTRSIYRDSIKAVKVIDDRTVEFEFFEPLFTNFQNALGMFVLPAHFYSKLTPPQLNRSTGLLMGAGPFRVKDFNPDRQWKTGDDLVLERNEYYSGTKPALATLRLKGIREEVSRLNAFKRADADIITPSAVQFRALQAEAAARAASEAPDPARYLEWINMRAGYSFIAWNCGKRNGRLTPFHDVRVRKAMTMLLDRERLIRDVYAGVGTVAKGVFSPVSPGTDPDLKPWPYDPKAAMALLADAGWKDTRGDGVLRDAGGNPFEFEFGYSSGSEVTEALAKFVSDSYGAAGIRVRLRPSEWAAFLDTTKTRDFDAVTMGWSASAPEADPRQVHHSDSIRNQGDNFVQWSSPEADRLIDAGRRTIDDAERALVWRKLERHMHEEQPYTYIRAVPWLRAVGPAAGNVVPYPKGLQHEEMFRSGPGAPAAGL